MALQVWPFETTQVYASWARGYKTPTYNTVNLLGTTFGPIKPVQAQKNDAYEVGIKTELFDQSLRLNAAAFYTTEYQLLEGFVSVLTGGVVSYDNVPSARIKGAEGDALWVPLRQWDSGLVLAASVSYLNGKYTDYPNGRRLRRQRPAWPSATASPCRCCRPAISPATGSCARRT